MPKKLKVTNGQGNNSPCMSCKECVIARRGRPVELPCTDVVKQSEPSWFINLYRMLRKNTPKSEWNAPKKKHSPALPKHLRLKRPTLKNSPSLPREQRVSQYRKAKGQIGAVAILEEPMDCRQWLSEETRDKIVRSELKDSTDLSEDRQKELQYKNVRRKMIARHAYLEPFLMETDEE